MSIYSTWLAIDDDGHPLTCATWTKAGRAMAESVGQYAVDGDGHYYVRSGKPCDCKHKAPIIYEGSHVNPTDDAPRGGYLLACAIPNHCHPSVRGQMTDDGPPVEYLRLSVGEDPTTYHGMEPGSATLVLDRRQVKKLHKTLSEWLDTRDRA